MDMYWKVISFLGLVALYHFIWWKSATKDDGIFHIRGPAISRDKWVKKMGSKYRLPSIENSTDPRHTRIEIDHTNNYTVGRLFSAMIHTYNYHNESKGYGGDLFQVVLHRCAVEGDGVAAEIIDHSNGSYSVTVPLLWEGDTKLKAILVQSSEAVAALQLKTSRTNGLGLGYIASVDGLETVECGAFLPERVKLCNFSNPVHGERWFCERPRVGCGMVTSYRRDDRSYRTKKWKQEFVEYLNSSKNWQVPIKGSGTVFTVNKMGSSESGRVNLTPFTPIMEDDRARWPRGYFLNNLWRSPMVTTREFTTRDIKNCLRNSFIWILGDSTAKQLYKQITKSVPQWEVRESLHDMVSKCGDNNITIRFKSHGPPLQKPGPFRDKQYLSLTLKTINHVPNRQTIILVSFGLHFLSFFPAYFRERVIILKKSFQDLEHRVPGVKIFVKSINFHYEVDYPLPRWQWLCHRLNLILSEQLKNMRNVIILDTWDMTLVQTPYDVHISPSMLQHQVNLWLSFICPSK